MAHPGTFAAPSLKPGFSPLSRASSFGTSRSEDGFAVAYNPRLAIRDGRWAGWRKPRLTPSRKPGLLVWESIGGARFAERGIPPTPCRVALDAFSFPRSPVASPRRASSFWNIGSARRLAGQPMILARCARPGKLAEASAFCPRAGASQFRPQGGLSHETRCYSAGSSNSGFSRNTRFGRNPGRARGSSRCAASGYAE
jgi:hypothetical protein